MTDINSASDHSQNTTTEESVYSSPASTNNGKE